MEDVINRLRESKQKGGLQKYQDGLEGGRQWAKESAEYAELEALETAFANPENRYEDDENSAYSSGESFFFAICPDQDGDRDGADTFWESVIPEGKHLANSAAYINGFIDGALEVWDEVKTQI